MTNDFNEELNPGSVVITTPTGTAFQLWFSDHRWHSATGVEKLSDLIESHDGLVIVHRAPKRSDRPQFCSASESFTTIANMIAESDLREELLLAASCLSWDNVDLNAAEIQEVHKLLAARWPGALACESAVPAWHARYDRLKKVVRIKTDVVKRPGWRVRAKDAWFIIGRQLEKGRQTQLWHIEEKML